MTTYGQFPGVKVETQSGGISGVSVGEEEILVLFGEANYAFDGNSLVIEGDDETLSVSANEAEQVTTPRLAGAKFGTGAELTNAMQDALGNGANIDFLYGVGVEREFVTEEAQSQQVGDLENVELVEHLGYHVDPDRSPTDTGEDVGKIGDMGVTVVDEESSDELTVEFRYNGAPGTPVEDAQADVLVNPLTGQYAAKNDPVEDLLFSYTYNDYASAFQSRSANNTVSEGETGIWLALSDSDAVSSDLNNAVANLREDFALVNAMQLAEPNDSKVYEPANTSEENGGAEAFYDTANYDSANNSVSAAHFYKFAPGRTARDEETIGGGLGGLFAGNSITDPIYNDVVSGYQELEQQFSRTEADDMREADVIPVRSGGSVRVKGNRSTNYSSADAVAADFWTRRIADRVILIAKQVGDGILGRINDAETRGLAERKIERQLRSLASQRLIKSNSDGETNWRVDAYQDPTNADSVIIDVSFTPYGIVKRVDETITVNTN